MSMDIVLWRHAQAQDWQLGCDDMARRLTTRGEKQAQRMAKWLDRQLPEGSRIFVSPAVRTEQTAMTLARKFKLCQQLSPEASASELLKLIGWPTAKGTVLLVGHQPQLGQLVSELMGWPATDCAIRKGAVWWLRNREREGVNQTTVVTVLSPDSI
jgi:phosphohistidine phosphatase